MLGTYASYTYHSYLSFKQYIKRGDKKGYRFKIKTVLYKDINFKGKTKTVYSYE
jgi:hypothetical protein